MNDFVLYELDIEPFEEELIDLLCKENTEVKFALGGESCTWNTHENDMKRFSKTHKDFLFCLYGQGSEAGDIWVKYFKNGKMQYCPANITFDEFDERKLK